MDKKDLTAIFEAIEQNAAVNYGGRVEGDYIGEDGLLYCGKCHTPKQCKVEFLGTPRTPPIACKCLQEKRNKEKAGFEHRQQMQRVMELKKNGFPDAEMQRWNFENDDNSNEKLTRIAHNYVDKFDEMYKRGKGLLLYGSVGTGKTFAAACIANALIDKGRPCLVTNFARLSNQLSGMYEGKQEFIDSLNRYHLLVIDDLATERDTSYMDEIVQNIIDSRYRAELPMIITTNLTSDELQKSKEVKKQRLYSRLFEMCIPVHVEGQNRRREKLITDYAEFKDMLGL